MKQKKKFTKDDVPQDFTLSLAMVDLLPVVFFSLAFILLGFMMKSPLFVIGAIISALSGLVKVLWKIIAAMKKKNIYPLFIQMRIVMPIGFILILVGFILYLVKEDASFLFQRFYNWYCLIFLALGVVGMILMTIFAIKLDSGEKKANWIEQITNSISQFCFFMACLLAMVIA